MKNKLMIATLASSMALAGCATDPATGQQTINKGVLGALGGAVAGAGISKATGGDHTARDAAIGAAVGGAVGLYMENQEKKLQEQMDGTGVTVERDEATGNIDLVMPGNITFGFDSDDVSPNFYNTLDKLASTMREYDQTTISVMGHTDNVNNSGNPNYNRALSERRARSVANYLVRQGVSSNRISIYGYGASDPVASNNTQQGRLQNRRVEIQINAPQKVQ